MVLSVELPPRMPSRMRSLKVPMPAHAEIGLRGVHAQGGSFRVEEAFTIDRILEPSTPSFSNVRLQGLLDVLHIGESAKGFVVEAEAIDPVLDCVLHDVVDHELRCRMFAGGVIAEAYGFDIAICIETIVVTGNYLVEDGEGVFANLCGMVEDHVLHDTQTSVVQCHHHLPVFDNAIVGLNANPPLGAK